jgi:hypothetical protein
MPLRRIAVFVACLFLPCVALAETCKYLDAEGRVIYSNTPNNPPKGATKVKCFEDPSPKTPSAAARNSDSKPGTAEARAKPRVSEDTQKTRDDDRRRILDEELAEELASQEAVRNGNERNYERFLERVQPYRDAVATHERNIEALKREIANLK